MPNPAELFFIQKQYLQFLVLFLTLQLALAQGLSRFLLEHLSSLGFEGVQLGLVGQFCDSAVGAQLELTIPGGRADQPGRKVTHVPTKYIYIYLNVKKKVRGAFHTKGQLSHYKFWLAWFLKNSLLQPAFMHKVIKNWNFVETFYFLRCFAQDAVYEKTWNWHLVVWQLLNNIRSPSVKARS